MDFATLMTNRIKKLVLFPFLMIMKIIYWIINKIDLLSLWDQIGIGMDTLGAILLSQLGYKIEHKVYKEGALLVTGASSGIGSHLAISLAEQGYMVFAAVRSLPDAHALKVHISSKYQHCIIPIQLDVTSSSSIQHAIKTMEHHLCQFPPNARQLIGVVNCASVPFLAPLEASTQHDWNQVFQVNTVGPMAVITACLPLLRNSNGRIINVSSASAMTASPLCGVYAASKMVMGLT